jgi:Tfp pilus assembly protein PilF
MSTAWKGLLFAVICPALFANTPERSPGLDAFKAGLKEQNSGDLKSAALHYQSALARDPELVSAAINLAILYEKWHEHAAAEKLYNEAVRVAPRSFAARYNRGQFRQKHGRLAEAREDYLLALELSPHEPSLYINLAGIEIRLFEKERDFALLRGAEQKLQSAERLKSQSPALYFNKARLMELQNAPGRARTFYEEAMRRYPQQSLEYRMCLTRTERLNRQLK